MWQAFEYVVVRLYRLWTLLWSGDLSRKDVQPLRDVREWFIVNLDKKSLMSVRVEVTWYWTKFGYCRLSVAQMYLGENVW